MIQIIMALLIALYQFRRAVFYKKRYVQTKKDINYLLKNLTNERNSKSVNDPK
jgi:hypothetical protein